MGDKFSLEQGIGSMVHAIAGPIIVYPNTGWEDTIPKWIFNEIQLRRLMRCMQESKNKVPPAEQGRALDVECLAYLYPATLYAPLDHEFANIYCWLAKTCMMSRMAGGKKMKESDFAGVADRDLSEDEKRELDRFKVWLWEKNQEQRLRLTKTGGCGEKVVEVHPIDESGQMLFGFVKEVDRGGVGRAKSEVHPMRQDGGRRRGPAVLDPGSASPAVMPRVQLEVLEGGRSGESEELGKPQGRRGTRARSSPAKDGTTPAC